MWVLNAQNMWFLYKNLHASNSFLDDKTTCKNMLIFQDEKRLLNPILNTLGILFIKIMCLL